MSASDSIQHITPDQRREGDPTPGMVREQAISTGGLWAGIVRTAPGMTSGWHHHGEHETAIHIAAGELRIESGPGGTQVQVAGAGDFLYVPPGTVHRESNPGDVESQIIVARAGHGPTTINVDGPAPT